MTLLADALALFWCWTVLRFILPFVIPDRLAIVLYGASGYGLTFVRVPHLTLGLAAAGGAVLLISLLKADPEPWGKDADWRAWLPRRPVRRSLTGIGHVPGEPPSKVGRRLPRL